MINSLIDFNERKCRLHLWFVVRGQNCSMGFIMKNTKEQNFDRTIRAQLIIKLVIIIIHLGLLIAPTTPPVHPPTDVFQAKSSKLNGAKNSFIPPALCKLYGNPASRLLFKALFKSDPQGTMILDTGSILFYFPAPKRWKDIQGLKLLTVLATHKFQYRTR